MNYNISLPEKKKKRKNLFLGIVCVGVVLLLILRSQITERAGW